MKFLYLKNKVREVSFKIWYCTLFAGRIIYSFILYLVILYVCCSLLYFVW